MIGAERNQMFTSPHLILFPGLAIVVTVLAFNLLGDGLRLAGTADEEPVRILSDE